jgi:hypothetical protein
MIDQLTQVAHYPDDFEQAFCDWMLEKVESGEDIDRFFLADLFVKQVDARRKFINTRLTAFRKTWDAHKKELRSQILAVIDAGEDKKAWHVMDGMGSVSVVKAKQKRAKIVDEEAAQAWLTEELARTKSFAGEYLEYITRLTDAGKTYLQEQALARDIQGYEAIPGVEVALPERTIAVKPNRRASNELIANLIETSIFADNTDHCLLEDQSFPTSFDESMEVFKEEEDE